jgi:hypothetical protein
MSLSKLTVVNTVVYGKHDFPVLATGTVNGRFFAIASVRGTHPCCYVEQKSGEDLSGLDVHGGITFNDDGSENGKGLPFDETNASKGTSFVGWDYAHAGDFFWMPFGALSQDDRKYTIGELIVDCVKAIESIE